MVKSILEIIDVTEYNDERLLTEIVLRTRSIVACEDALNPHSSSYQQNPPAYHKRRWGSLEELELNKKVLRATFDEALRRMGGDSDDE